ncbi:hypothetical protein Sps_05560 [Shewanella psychrophila]|uniref:Translocator protein BipB-like C-terminal domain-containing protein n=1 Tax=Shewanella psychrophila TaxID=225848 RepID=A0A1S6HYL3_9GAMM|nr:type III secretion system translocon subunit SctE [Shewanella psychrophila]AQS40623.1 hypothetical protein Sps_05560 [Shewanella psychrophila]
MNQITLTNPLAQSAALLDTDQGITNAKLGKQQEQGVTVSRNTEQQVSVGINKQGVMLDKPNPLMNTSSLTSADKTFNELSSLMNSNQQAVKDLLDKTGDMFAKFLTSSFQNGAGLPKELAKGAEYGIGSAFIALSASSVEDFEIELAKTTTELERAQNKLKSEEIKRVRSENEAQMKDNQTKIKESEEAAQEAKKSGLFGKIFGYISAALSIIIGAVMIATGVGAVAGAAMIAGGVFGIVSQVLQEPAVQSALKDAGINVEAFQKVMMALEIISAVVSTVASFGGAAVGKAAQLAGKVSTKIASGLTKVADKLDDLAKLGTAINKFGTAATKVRTISTITETGANVAQGTASTVNTAFQANAVGKQAETEDSRAEVLAMRAVIDRLKEEISRMSQEFQEVMQMIMQMINANGDSMKEILSRPAAV